MTKIENFKNFIGVDVSKKTLDFCVIVNEKQSHYVIENNRKQIKTKFAQLKKECKIEFHNTLICVDLTGDYTNLILDYLSEFGANIWLEMPIKIKQSSGLNRLKTDKIDSMIIANYAKRFKDKFIPWKKPRKQIYQLKKLYYLREKVIKSIVQYKSTINEYDYIIDNDVKKIQQRTFKTIVNTLTKEKIKIEEEIKAIIKADDKLNHIFKIVTSVIGVGFVAALDMIISTNEFETIKCPKKYACYSGIAPFEQSSGTALYKSRISHMANKNSKKALHLGAMSAIVKPGELKEYYYRKLSEGKPKMSALNAVRNKIVLRVFSCIKNNKIYIPN